MTRLPLAALAAAVLAAVAPAPAAALDLTNARNTYGGFGPTRADSKFLPGDVLFLAFDMEGLTIGDDGRAQYATQLEVVDKDGKKVLDPPVSERIDFVAFGGGRVPNQAFVTLGVDQAPGTYTARVTVTDKPSKATKTLERKFEVLPPDFGIVGVYASSEERGSSPSPMTGVVGQTIHILFQAVGFKRDAKGQPNLHFEMTPLDEAGKPTLPKPITHDLTAWDEKVATYPLRFSAPLNRPGKFTVRLSCTDKMSGKTATIDLPVVALAADK